MIDSNGAALARREYAASISVLLDEARVDTLRRTIAKELSDDELSLFVMVCNRTGLDPFTKQIYALKVQGRLILHIGIDGYRLVAERSGKYGGQLGPYWAGADGRWLEVWLDANPPAAARVGVVRKDWPVPVWAVARMRSYGRDTPTWKTMPDVMLAKAAESLALRKAFPNELGGLRHDPGLDSEDESEYRQVDHETGEITETPREPAGPASAGQPGASAAQPDQVGLSQPAPENTADRVQAMFDAPTSPRFHEATEAYEKAQADGANVAPPNPRFNDEAVDQYVQAMGRAMRAKKPAQ